MDSSWQIQGAACLSGERFGRATPAYRNTGQPKVKPVMWHSHHPKNHKFTYAGAKKKTAVRNHAAGKTRRTDVVCENEKKGSPPEMILHRKKLRFLRNIPPKNKKREAHTPLVWRSWSRRLDRGWWEPFFPRWRAAWNSPCPWKWVSQSTLLIWH